MTQEEIKQAWEESTGSCWPDDGCFTAGEYDFHILAFANKIRNAALEESAIKSGVFAQQWWTKHCATNKHMQTSREAHEDFCLLQAQIRRMKS